MQKLKNLDQPNQKCKKQIKKDKVVYADDE